MLARITGLLERLENNVAVIAPTQAPTDGVAGLHCPMAFEVLVPAFIAESLAARLGEVVTLHTLQHLEPVGQGSAFVPRLIGFSSLEERRFFELFTTVKGVGTRKALKAMSAPIGEIAAAVSERDTRALQRLPEIGKRLAETMVAELHGKVEAFLGLGVPPARGGASPEEGAAGEAEQQAVAALVRLGQSRSEAEVLVRRVRVANPGRRTPDEILAAAFALRP